MERIPELRGFFEEVFERFNCSRDAQEKYNRFIRKIVEHIVVSGDVKFKILDSNG